MGDSSPFGPAWELLAAIPSKLDGDNLWANLIFFKLLIILAYGVSVAFTYVILHAVRSD